MAVISSSLRAASALAKSPPTLPFRSPMPPRREANTDASPPATPSRSFTAMAYTASGSFSCGNKVRVTVISASPSACESAFSSSAQTVEGASVASSVPLAMVPIRMPLPLSMERRVSGISRWPDVAPAAVGVCGKSVTFIVLVSCLVGLHTR
ncbi:hypothetical protein SDC9_136869 [bioreactor metagenome]|uniref:Uncharacterized protein n=1 Tax=bioreactor metagenome TaxID=1076179 RepID=A0A645DKG3_9ZZZZ